MAQVAAAADAVRVSSTKGSLRAEVAYSRQLGKAAIDVTGLPPAPAGKTYQLWYVGPDQVARSAGLLTADADGRGSMLLQGDANAAAAVGMTVEPAGGSAQPTTDPVVVLALA
jgi:anti-sigma-K factor RskA